MIKKTLVITTYIIDNKSGSEPAITFHFIKKMSCYFEKILVFTSSLTPDVIILELRSNCKNISIIKTPFSVAFPRDKFGLFYMKYRIYLLRQAAQISKLKLNPDTNIGIHFSLSNHLLGTSLYKSGIPYVFGPGSTSKFHTNYWRIARFSIVYEWFRFILIHLIIQFDLVVKKSLNHSSFILVGDDRTRELLESYSYRSKLSLITIPHTAIDLVQIQKSYVKQTRQENLMWCGSFKLHKDAKLALQVMKSLRDDFGRDELVLKMYGSGGKLKQLIRYQRKFQLTNVEIYAWIGKDELFENMNRTKLLLFTSYRESGGAQLIEALAHDMKVVSTDATGIKHLLDGKTVKFIGPVRSLSRKKFAKEFAKEVLAQYDSQHSRNQMADFSSEKQALLILEVLKSIH